MKNLKSVGVAALAMVVLSLGSYARSSTLSYTVTGSVGPAQANWSLPLTVAQFPSSLGTLTSVTLTLDGTMSTTLIAGNITGTTIVSTSESSSGSVSTVAQLSLQDSSGSLSGTPQLSIMSPFEPYTLAAGSSESWSLGSTTGSGSATYTDAYTLGEFTGAGTITLTASANAFTDQVNTGGASYATETTNAGLVADVTYTYSAPVPEPSTYALLGGSIAALVSCRRRWRRRV